MTTNELVPGAHDRRKFNLLAKPFWRKREMAMGLLRGKLVTRDLGLSHSPIIHKGVSIRRAHGIIEFGKFCEIHQRVIIGAGSGSAHRPARVTIGDFTSIWFGTILSARNEIAIGSHSTISWNCTIIDNDMHEILDSIDQDTRDDKPRGTRDDEFVRIGDHVWVGASAIILKGVTIGANAVIAAGAVVTRDVPPNTLVAGIPARPVRQIAGWR